MSFEPQKFYIGVVDFFSILMPGALLAYLSYDPHRRCMSLGQMGHLANSKRLQRSIQEK